LLVVVFAILACTPAEVNLATTSTSSSLTTSPSTAPADLPSILAVGAGSEQVGNYGLVELTVDFDADYGNPFYQREVALDVVFTRPTATNGRSPVSGMRVTMAGPIHPVPGGRVVLHGDPQFTRDIALAPHRR
jgi:hypothetical protein